MKAKDYRQVLQELGNIMDEAVHIVDATGKTILYNEKMAGLEMTNREDILGKPFREVFSSIPPQESTLYRALKENQATINKQQTYRKMCIRDRDWILSGMRMTLSSWSGANRQRNES